MDGLGGEKEYGLALEHLFSFNITCSLNGSPALLPCSPAPAPYPLLAMNLGMKTPSESGSSWRRTVARVSAPLSAASAALALLPVGARRMGGGARDEDDGARRTSIL